jgi:hypothetical protein
MFAANDGDRRRTLGKPSPHHEIVIEETAAAACFCQPRALFRAPANAK